MDAAASWGEELRGRAIPPEILAAAPESPWTCPVELFRSRALKVGSGNPTPTTVRALEALPPGGIVLDVGCGGGATSLPLAERAGAFVGVDTSSDMASAFLDAVRWLGSEITVIEGSWPDVAPSVPDADVVVCGHVLYNVQELLPFVAALDAHARRRAVVEVTERHPLSWMNDLWRRFHDVVFPDGPTADLAELVLRDAGLGVRRQDRTTDRSRGHGGFERREDAVALIRRRLCLPAERDGEIAVALGDRLTQDDAGLWSAGPADQTVVTLWWDAAG